jgi:cytochrome c2
MPAYFHQSNNSDESFEHRCEQEIHALVHFLRETSVHLELRDLDHHGSAARGEELFHAKACDRCHRISESALGAGERELVVEAAERTSNLYGIGSKLTRRWMANWLLEPKRLMPDTEAPDEHLSEREAADLAAFLSTSTHQTFMRTPIPDVDEYEIDAMLLPILVRHMSESKARSQVAAMDTGGKLLFLGHELVHDYRCFACHRIRTFANDRFGYAKLRGIASRPADEFDFTFVDIDYTTGAWLRQKLKDPRIFEGFEGRNPAEKQRMPNYSFNDDELNAIMDVMMTWR